MSNTTMMEDFSSHAGLDAAFNELIDAYDDGVLLDSRFRKMSDCEPGMIFDHSSVMMHSENDDTQCSSSSVPCSHPASPVHEISTEVPCEDSVGEGEPCTPCPPVRARIMSFPDECGAVVTRPRFFSIEDRDGDTLLRPRFFSDDDNMETKMLGATSHDSLSAPSLPEEGKEAQVEGVVPSTPQKLCDPPSPSNPASSSPPPRKTPSPKASVSRTPVQTTATTSLASFFAGKSASTSEGCVVGRYTQAERLVRLQRFREKRAQRVFGKKIKYLDRKIQAESQIRVRGRFAKASELKAMREAGLLPPLKSDLSVAADPAGDLPAMPSTLGMVSAGAC